MGSAARANRCDRFIQEFNADACLRDDHGDLPGFHSQHLAMRDSDEMVYLYVMLRWREREYELMMDYIFFDPEEPEPDMVKRVCEQLGIEADEAEERLRKADLIT